MVVVHEFGHFAVAKLCGVRVEAFSVGFGPRLFGIKYGDTDYKVCLLPLGGFVKMTGENPGEESAGDDPGAFSTSSPLAAHAHWGGWVRLQISFSRLWLMVAVLHLHQRSSRHQDHDTGVGDTRLSSRPGRFAARRRVSAFDNTAHPDFQTVLRPCRATTPRQDRSGHR